MWAAVTSVPLNVFVKLLFSITAPPTDCTNQGTFVPEPLKLMDGQKSAFINSLLTICRPLTGPVYPAPLVRSMLVLWSIRLWSMA